MTGPIQRLVRDGFTVTMGPSPETKAIRIHVRKPDGPGATRFVPWDEIDYSRDGGEALFQWVFSEIEELLRSV
jgi:hypothetical protein